MAVARRAPRVLTVLRATGGKARWDAVLVAAAALEDLRLAIDECPEGVPSREWPDNFSLLSYAEEILGGDGLPPLANLVGGAMAGPTGGSRDPATSPPHPSLARCPARLSFLAARSSGPNPSATSPLTRSGAARLLVRLRSAR
jgi:hypothetical protein